MQFLKVPAGAKTIVADGLDYADFANVHNYVSSTGDHYVDNQAWNAADPTGRGPWDGLFQEYGVTWRGNFKGYSDELLRTLPRVSTETGWDSKSKYGGERTQGTILVNTYLSQFKQGWRYTFIYQLRDGEGGNGVGPGLFNLDSSPKLAATYIHNLTNILADDAPLNTTASLNYSIRNQPDTVHDMLLQKSTGALELVVWDEKVSGTDHVTISLGTAQAKVKVYDVTLGPNPIQTFTNTESLDLDLSDHALVIEILR